MGSGTLLTEELSDALKRIAISENGFLFDPGTGKSYRVNETGLLILRALQNRISESDCLDTIQQHFDISESRLRQELEVFTTRLRAILGV